MPRARTPFSFVTTAQASMSRPNKTFKDYRDSGSVLRTLPQRTAIAYDGCMRPPGEVRDGWEGPRVASLTLHRTNTAVDPQSKHEGWVGGKQNESPNA